MHRLHGSVDDDTGTVCRRIAGGGGLPYVLHNSDGAVQRDVHNIVTAEDKPGVRKEK